MSHAADMPLWAALLVSFFLLLGAGLTLLGTIGMVRFATFYNPVSQHPSLYVVESNRFC